jgi:hypothetical protein
MTESSRTVAICVQNAGYEVSLELGRRYAVIADAAAKQFGYLRVVDESAESYLYPKEYFQTP